MQTNAARARFLASSPELRVVRPPKDSWPAGTQFCGVCRSFVPIWYSRSSRCKACASAAAHAKGIEKTYGVELRAYNAILRAQGGRCGICRSVPRSARLAVDHDHATGQVRGLLCKRCNHDLLGAAHDDVEVLRRAVAYLESPPATRLPRP